MKKKLANIIFIPLLALFVIISLTGCGNNSETTTTPDNPTGDPSPSDPGSTTDPGTTDPTPEDTIEAKVNTLFKSLENNNFTALLKQGDESIIEEYTEKLCKITTGSDSSSVIKYIERENDKNYLISSQNDLWIKEETNDTLGKLFSFSTIIKDATIETAKEDVATGKIDNKSYSLNLTNNTINYDGWIIELSNINSTTITLPDSIWTEDFDKEEINNIFKNIPNNFVCSYTANNETHTIKVDDNKFILEGNEDIIYSYEEEKWVSYTKENDIWTKSLTNNRIYLSIDTIKNYEVSLKNIVDNTYLIKNIPEEGNSSIIFASIEDDKITLNDNEIITTLDKIGNTTIELPTEYVDDITTIFTIDENNVYHFDLVEMKKIYDKYLGEDKGLVELTGDKYKSLNNIVYIYASKYEITVGIIFDYTASGNKYLQTIRINDSTFYKNIASYSKAKDFADYLNSITYKELCFGEDIKIDQTITSEQLSSMTESIFTRLAEVGYQGSSINNEGTKVEGLKPENVLFAFKGVTSGTTVGYDIGYHKYWSQYYLVEKDGGVCFIIVYLASSTTGDVYENIINDVDGRWMVAGYQETELNPENADLYK